MADTEEPVVVRWFTPIKRFQRLIGKSPGGGYYPGGPYTILQFVGAAAVVVLGEATVGVWGRFGWITDNAAILVVAVTVLFALGFVKSGGRNPVAAGVAIGAALAAPANGEYNGHRIRTPRPVTVRHRINALTVDPQEIVDALEADPAALAARKEAVPASEEEAEAPAKQVTPPAAPTPPTTPAPVPPVPRATAMTSVQRMLANLEKAS